MNTQNRGASPRTPQTFWKKFDKNFFKNRASRDFLIIFAPLFLKSGWGFGGEAPKILFMHPARC